LAEAGELYHALARNATLTFNERDGCAVAAAACDLKLKRLTVTQAQALPDSHDENGARRQYLLMELARNRNDDDEQQRIVAQMKTDFPQSPWLAEALFSSGNMYLLRRDYATAAGYYSYLAIQFPSHKNAAAAHWRAGWLNYRQGLYSDAARMFDEQIKLFPNATETAAALYWRGRLYEVQENNRALAASNIAPCFRVYQHFFYAQMARQRRRCSANHYLFRTRRPKDATAAHSTPCGHISLDSPGILRRRAWSRMPASPTTSPRKSPPIRIQTVGVRWLRRSSMLRSGRATVRCAH
jgi:soluble lytic murein transglycosylase